jgi:hypothetical protein
MPHTPGPWRITTTNKQFSNSVEGYSGRKSHSGDDGFRTVATFQDCGPSRLDDESDANMLANGRLIAAAPDLLEACEEMLRASFASDPADIKSARKKANDAVAKTKGA